MLVVLVGLFMSGMGPIQTVPPVRPQAAPVPVTASRPPLAAQSPALNEAPPSPLVRAPATRTAARAPATRLPPAMPVARYSVLASVEPGLREATICAGHMELLIEKVTARSMEVETPIWLIQEFWQGQLPDPDAEEAISGDVLSEVKSALNAKSSENPDLFLRQLQACVTEAARGGALLN